MVKKSLIFTLLLSFISFGPSSNSFALNSVMPPPVILSDIQILKGVVKSGDTASSLLNKYLPLKTIYEISRLSSDVFSLTRIRKGQPYKIILEQDNLVGFEYEIDKEDRLLFSPITELFLKPFYTKTQTGCLDIMMKREGLFKKHF